MPTALIRCTNELAELSPAIVTYCRHNALGLNGLADVLAGQPLTFTTACTLLAYCERNALQLGGLVRAVAELVQQYVACVSLNGRGCTVTTIRAATATRGRLVLTYKQRPYLIEPNSDWGGDFSVTMPGDGSRHTGSLAHCLDLVRTWGAADEEENKTVNLWARILAQPVSETAAVNMGANRLACFLGKLGRLVALCAPVNGVTKMHRDFSRPGECGTEYHTPVGETIVITFGPGNGVEEDRATFAHHVHAVAVAQWEASQTEKPNSNEYRATDKEIAQHQRLADLLTQAAAAATEAGETSTAYDLGRKAENYVGRVEWMKLTQG